VTTNQTHEAHEWAIRTRAPSPSPNHPSDAKVTRPDANQSTRKAATIAHDQRVSVDGALPRRAGGVVIGVMVLMAARLVQVDTSGAEPRRLDSTVAVARLVRQGPRSCRSSRVGRWPGQRTGRVTAARWPMPRRSRGPRRDRSPPPPP
jgi:hypothetical protein